MKEDENEEEVGSGTWRREDNCVVDCINIQSMEYVDGLQLHKVHK